MSKLATLLALTLFCLPAAYAQMPMFGNQGPAITGKISGTIIDSASQKPVEFATVSISKSGDAKALNGTLSDASGAFKLEEIKAGKYRLTLSFLGYQDKIIDPVITTGEKPDISLGKILLSSSDVLLNEVEVVGQSAVIESKVDRIVYNADKDVSISGGDASDVLRKVPLLSVDLEGNVQLRGSSNLLILINGKPSGTMANSVADALKMIPADQIKSVEVITSPSAKYDAEGTAGIINIITRKKNLEGFNGSTNLGAGTRSLDGSLNTSLKKGRVAYTAGLGGRYTIPAKGYSEFEREDYIGDITRSLVQKGDFTGVRNTYFVNLGVDYDLNAYHNFSTNAKVNSTIYKGENDLEVLLNDPYLGLNQQYRRESNNRNEFANIDWSADYRRTFKKSGQELSASGQWSQNRGLNQFDVLQDGSFPGINLDEKSDNDSKNREFTLQTDYVHPFKKITLETGAKAIIRNILTENDYRRLDSTGIYVPVPERENNFEYHQNVASVYGVIGFKFAKDYEFKGGLRYEHTVIDGDFAGGEIPISNDYGNLLPSATIARTFKNFKTLKLSYSQRIQRPSLFYLNPFINAADPKNISFGNPYLLPELTKQLEMNYSTFFKGTALNISGFYRRTTDVIQNILTIPDSATVSVTSFLNTGLNQSFGVNLFGSWQITNSLVLRGSVNLYEVMLRGEVEGQTIENNAFQYNLVLSSSYTFKQGWSAEFFGLINSPRATLQGENPTFNITNFAVKKEIWKKKGSISLNITNPFTPYLTFSSDMSGSNFKQRTENGIPFRAVGLSFNYRFGKIDFKQPSMPGQKKRGVNNDDLKREEGGF